MAYSISGNGASQEIIRYADGRVEFNVTGGNTYNVSIGNDPSSVKLRGPSGSESALIESLISTPISYDSPFVFPAGKTNTEQLLSTIIQKANLLQTLQNQQQALNVCSEMRQHMQMAIVYTEQASSAVEECIKKANEEFVKMEREYSTVAELLRSAQDNDWSASLQLCKERLDSRKMSIQNAIKQYAQVATGLKQLNTSLKEMLAKHEFLKIDVSLIKDLIQINLLDPMLVSTFIDDVRTVEQAFRAFN